jgi:hypothetical protein
MSRDRDRPIGYDELKAFAVRLGRPVKSLIALSTPNDPYLAGSPARLLAAAWFADLWATFRMQPGSHVRRLHYIMVSQETLLPLPNGEGQYVNTLGCSQLLHRASADARYLGMISDGVIIDRRNPEANVYLAEAAEEPADIKVFTGHVWNRANEGASQQTVLSIPYITLARPTMGQRFHIEIWCEKSTMNDILLPIGEEYGINVVTAAGETSLTACELLVARVRESERPCRILYLSDHDPAGQGMPISVARKIEYVIGRSEADLDIQLQPVALTPEQCVEYRLPRTPLKESETRAEKFGTVW